MNVSLTAKMSNYKDFFKIYQPGDEDHLYDNKSLLYFAIANNDPESRSKICDFLLERGVIIGGSNEENENMLHILLSRLKHDLEYTFYLYKLLIDNGVDMCQLDKRNRSPIQHLLNMKYSDEELAPFYDVLFELPNLPLTVLNAWGKSPMQLAEILPYRTELLERMKAYEAKK